MKNLLLILSIFCFSSAQAQFTPQYYADHHPQGVGVMPYPNPVFTDHDIQQSLYAPDSFKNNPPYGRIKNVYLRTGLNWKPSCKTYKMNVGLGYTNMTNFDTCTRLFTNVTLVAKPDSLVMGDSVGDWMQIPLSGEDSFFFDPSQNLIVSLHEDSGVVLNYCWFLGSFSDSLHYYWQQGLKINQNIPSLDKIRFDFGFDLYTTGIDAISNLDDLGVFPNPARGKCTVSFSVKKPVSGFSLSLKNVTGKTLIDRQYDESPGSRFKKEIDLSLVAPGMYLLELKAGAEKITRKLLVH